MYIVIAGCRKVGSNLAKLLAQENHDVVVIDSDTQNFDLLGSGFNGLTIAGMPIDEDILLSAGIDKADALAAVTNDDNMNVMISQIASNIFHVPNVITHITDPERDVVFRTMGLHTICPTTLAVEQVKELLIKTGRHLYFGLDGAGISFEYVQPTRHVVGKTIASFMQDRIFGLLREGKFIFAEKGLKIMDHDTLIVADYTGKDDSNS